VSNIFPKRNILLFLNLGVNLNVCVSVSSGEHRKGLDKQLGNGVFIYKAETV